MSRILAFTKGAEDWQKLLADPEKQWRKGYSARTLAHCWEAADGFPPEVADSFSLCSEPLLESLEPLLAVPEFKVALPGGGRPSQNDIFVLARSAAGPVSIMVEGKVNESFGPTLEDWSRSASPGKKRRLNFLSRTLGLNAKLPGDLRYQLLHRAASAIIIGEQYRAAAAVLLVHSFSPDYVGWADFQNFTELFGVDPVPRCIQRLNGPSRVPLFAVWVAGNTEFLAS